MEATLKREPQLQILIQRIASIALGGHRRSAGCQYDQGRSYQSGDHDVTILHLDTSIVLGTITLERMGDQISAAVLHDGAAGGLHRHPGPALELALRRKARKYRAAINILVEQRTYVQQQAQALALHVCSSRI